MIFGNIWYPEKEHSTMKTKTAVFEAYMSLAVVKVLINIYLKENQYTLTGRAYNDKLLQLSRMVSMTTVWRRIHIKI